MIKESQGQFVKDRFRIVIIITHLVVVVAVRVLCISSIATRITIAGLFHAIKDTRSMNSVLVTKLGGVGVILLLLVVVVNLAFAKRQRKRQGHGLQRLVPWVRSGCGVQWNGLCVQ